MSLLIPCENKKAALALMHTGAWILYGSSICIVNHLVNPGTRIIHTIFFLVPHCFTFYVSIYCLGLYKKPGIGWSIVSFIIVFAVMTLLGYVYFYAILPMAGITVFRSYDFSDYLEAAGLGCVQYFSYAIFYFHIVRFFKKKRQLRQLQEEKLIKELENAKLRERKLKSELEKLLLEYAFLRSQVNPHFLHNTLNVLFSQALEYSQELADNISRLSRMMRYSMESAEPGRDTVFVGKELDNLGLLIEINNSRFGDSKTIEFSVEGEIDDQMVPPLAMITAVENAFKYGDLKDPGDPLKVMVKLRPGQVHFFCRNKKGKYKPTDQSTHTGIANLSKRLDLSFKDRYIMNVQDKDGFYTFELFIKN